MKVFKRRLAVDQVKVFLAALVDAINDDASGETQLLTTAPAVLSGLKGMTTVQLEVKDIDIWYLAEREISMVDR